MYLITLLLCLDSFSLASAHKIYVSFPNLATHSLHANLSYAILMYSSDKQDHMHQYQHIINFRCHRKNVIAYLHLSNLLLFILLMKMFYFRFLVMLLYCYHNLLYIIVSYIILYKINMMGSPYLCIYAAFCYLFCYALVNSSKFTIFALLYLIYFNL